MKNYAATAASATKMLTQFGQTVTRTIVTAGAYDLATDTVTQTETTESRIGAVFDFADALQNMRGNLIQVYDKRLYLDPNGSAALTDRYTIGGTQYTVVSISETNPAGTVVLYDLHLRRA
jgi:nanoRNase/pAp phosphatase (c-di-AMP/oligoRNAs hydrolase)